jgi:hypothetical protein
MVIHSGTGSTGRREPSMSARRANELALAYWQLGFGHHYAAHKVEAWQTLSRACHLWDDLCQRYPDDGEYAAQRRRTLMEGRLRLAAGDLARAAAAEAVVAQAPREGEVLHQASGLLCRCAEAARQRNDTTEARQYADRARACLKQAREVGYLLHRWLVDTDADLKLLR